MQEKIDALLKLGADSGQAEKLAKFMERRVQSVSLMFQILCEAADFAEGLRPINLPQGPVKV